jgi:hypothetical protein
VRWDPVHNDDRATGGITESDQTLDMYSGVLKSAFTYKDPASPSSTPFSVDVTTVVDSDSDAVAVRYAAPASVGLSVQIAFCNLEPGGGACDWRPNGGGTTTNMTTTVLGVSENADRRGGRVDIYREITFDT